MKGELPLKVFNLLNDVHREVTGGERIDRRICGPPSERRRGASISEPERSRSRAGYDDRSLVLGTPPLGPDLPTSAPRLTGAAHLIAADGGAEGVAAAGAS